MTNCKIIAELGTLHNSSFANLTQATHDCLNAGADLVKVQLISAETAWWATAEQKKRYKKRDFDNIGWYEYFSNPEFKDRIFASVFDEHYVDYFEARCLKKTCMPIWKLGYKALSMPALVQRVLDTNKPVYISVTCPDDIVKILNTNNYTHQDNITFLYVQPVYPTPSDQILLPKFGAMPAYWYQGLSSHCNDMYVYKAALCLGAQLIEVHVQGKGASGADTSFALDMEQLSDLVHMRDQHSVGGIVGARSWGVA